MSDYKFIQTGELKTRKNKVIVFEGTPKGIEEDYRKWLDNLPLSGIILGTAFNHLGFFFVTYVLKR